MDLAEPHEKIAVGGGGVDFVAELLEGGPGGVQPRGGGKGEQRGLVAADHEVEGLIHLNLRTGGAASGPLSPPDFMRREPTLLVTSPRAFFRLSMPRATTLRLVQ